MCPVGPFKKLLPELLREDEKQGARVVSRSQMQYEAVQKTLPQRVALFLSTEHYECLPRGLGFGGGAVFAEHEIL